MEKYKIQTENTSKRLSFRSKIPGIAWDTPPPHIDRDYLEAQVEWGPPPPITGAEWDPSVFGGSNRIFGIRGGRFE